MSRRTIALAAVLGIGCDDGQRGPRPPVPLATSPIATGPTSPVPTTPAPTTNVPPSLVLESLFPRSAGVINVLVVSGATPGAEVLLSTSPSTGAVAVAGCAGLEVDADSPRAVADADGVAALSLAVDPALVGSAPTYTAVQPDGCGTSPARSWVYGAWVPLAGADAKLVGTADGDQAGWSIDGAGDLNGDGLDDLVIGARSEGTAGHDAGASYVFYGPGPRGVVQLAEADAVLYGARRDHRAGIVAGVGDIDGDGFDDLLIGANGHDGGGADAGAAHLVYGPVAGDLDLGAADATLLGAPGDLAGGPLAGGGDPTGDGLPDLLVSAPWSDAGVPAGGALYLVSGPQVGDVALADSVRLVGRGVADLISAVDVAGDVDGDGVDDVIVGSAGNDEAGGEAGAVYVVLGPVTADRSLADADATWLGEAYGDNAGASVAGAGDVDGDGLSDLVIGAPEHAGTGAAYLVRGFQRGSHSLAAADAFLPGELPSDRAGRSVAGPGDVDGDGFDDLWIGASDSDGYFEGAAGAVYLVRGPGTGTFELGDASVRIYGEGDSRMLGWSVAGAGDVDGDGHPDLLVGAYASGAAWTRTGGAHLFLATSL